MFSVKVRSTAKVKRYDKHASRAHMEGKDETQLLVCSHVKTAVIFQAGGCKLHTVDNEKKKMFGVRQGGGGRCLWCGLKKREEKFGDMTAAFSSPKKQRKREKIFGKQRGGGENPSNKEKEKKTAR